MASKIWELLELSEAIQFGTIIVAVIYSHGKPVKLIIKEKRPEWTERDLKRVDE